MVREGAKLDLYTAALRAITPPDAFPSLVSRTYCRLGLLTGAWLRDAPVPPRASAAQLEFLTAVLVPVWVHCPRRRRWVRRVFRSIDPPRTVEEGSSGPVRNSRTNLACSTCLRTDTYKKCHTSTPIKKYVRVCGLVV